MMKQEVVSLLKRAAQTETLIYSSNSTFGTSCVMEEDYKILKYVLEELLPKIEDIKYRHIVWLRAHDVRWKLIGQELSCSEAQCKRFYKKGIEKVVEYL